MQAVGYPRPKNKESALCSKLTHRRGTAPHGGRHRRDGRMVGADTPFLSDIAHGAHVGQDG